MNISVNKQSSICVEDGKILFFDPWDVPGEGKADVIFITHDHGDHFSPADVKKLAADNTIVVCPEKMCGAAAEKTGIPADRILPVVPGKEYEAGGVKFETVAMYNEGKPFHQKSDGWCGYVAILGGTRYYVTGDLDAIPEAAAVKCDVLFIPVGGKFTMDTQQAAELAAKIQPKCAIPTHYGAVVGTPEDGRFFAENLKKLAPEIAVELELFK